MLASTWAALAPCKLVRTINHKGATTEPTTPNQQISENDLIDLQQIDESTTVIEVEGPQESHHRCAPMSAQHVEEIRRRHRRERFLVKLDLILLIVVCASAGGILSGLQFLQ